MNKKSSFNMLKNLGIIPRYYEDKNQIVKVRCPFHEDTHASLRIDYENEKNDKAPYYSSSWCHTCKKPESNVNIYKYWLQTFTSRDANDNKTWSWAKDVFEDKLIKTFFGEKENFENKSEQQPFGVDRSYNYNNVKEVVLRIFNEERLNKLNVAWEDQLKYLVEMKELGVERQNAASPWNLVFKIGFGPDYNISAVRYQPDNHPKALMQKADVPTTGLFMPFFLGEEQGAINPENIYHSNLIANQRKTIFIVEGQKDMLTLWLMGIPAITITGGCEAQARVPELFTDKNVFIIYDNDEAGVQGAKKLATQLGQFAKTVKVSTNVYGELEEKEDAYDFFFKYDNDLNDFKERLTNPENFIVYDRDRILQEKQEAEREKHSVERMKHTEKVKEIAGRRKYPFNDIFSCEPHNLFQFEARLDKIESKVAHSIYLRPVVSIVDNRPNEEKVNQSIDKDFERLTEKINDLNSYYKQITGFDKYKVTFEKTPLYNYKGDTKYLGDVISNYQIERILSHDDFDILEQIILGRNGYGANEAKAYRLAGAFKEITNALSDFRRNINKRGKKDNLHTDEISDGPAKPDEEQIVAPLWKSTGGKITIDSTDFNKKYVTDYTAAMVYEDKDHSELSETLATFERTYKVLLPSHILTSDTKIGDRVTIYGGKLKRQLDNQPYILGWHFDYRDEIDNFELDDGVKLSLNKFKFKGETLEELKAHQYKMYNLWMWHSDAEYTTKMWEAVELGFTSIARSQRLMTDGTPETFKSALDIAIVGDSRIGKSESVKRAKTLYKVGVPVEMLNASAIGLIGGSDTTKNNQVTLGTLPLNHRGLVELDELSAISNVETRDDIFKRMHVSRVEGRAVIDRVAGKVVAPCDTRIISTSNPVGRVGGAAASNPSMASFKSSSYWTVLDRLLPSIPVKARFTFVYFPTTAEFAKETQDEGAPNSKYAIKARVQDNQWQPMNREDYFNKITWAWSRKPENVTIDSELYEYTRLQVRDKLKPVLHVENGEEIGIYTDGTTSSHVINAAIALASSTVSTDDTLENIIVKPVHIDYIVEFILSLYGAETGIPEKLEIMRKSSNYDEEEIDLLFGDRPYTFSKFFRNKALTLSDDNDLIMRVHMYELYEQLYNFTTDSGEGASTNIAWGHVEAYFDMVLSRWNEIIMNPGDESRGKFANIGQEQLVRNSKELMGAWKQLMSKLGVIKERANQKQHFFLQAKYGLMWNSIKERYHKLYDPITHERKQEDK